MRIESTPVNQYTYTVTLHESDMDEFLQQLREVVSKVDGVYGYGKLREFEQSLRTVRMRDLRTANPIMRIDPPIS